MSYRTNYLTNVGFSMHSFFYVVAQTDQMGKLFVGGSSAQKFSHLLSLW